jgi:hypothetical protein
MNRALRAASLAGLLAFAAAGCNGTKDQSDRDPHAGHDHRPRPEGRLDVDQSATLPVDVKAGVQREYPGAAVVDVRKLTQDDRVVRYEVRVRRKDGKEAVRVFNEDGKPASAPVPAGK